MTTNENQEKEERKERSLSGPRLYGGVNQPWYSTRYQYGGIVVYLRRRGEGESRILIRVRGTQGL